MGWINRTGKKTTVRFSLGDLLREPEHIGYALANGAFNNFLASVAWSILEKHERQPFGTLQEANYTVGEITETGEVFIEFNDK